MQRRGRQAKRHDQLVETRDIARLDVRVSDRDQQLPLGVGIEDDVQGLHEHFDALATVVRGQGVVEHTAFPLREQRVDALGQIASDLHGVRVVDGRRHSPSQRAGHLSMLSWGA